MSVAKPLRRSNHVRLTLDLQDVLAGGFLAASQNVPEAPA
jgi:hypothetical protein